jgi:glycosyltransferase involved in cell wall biosynthesis
LKWSVGDIYSISDLVFVPSKEEGFGLPVIEAGAARKMVFCSRIPPFQELIREDIDGFMFDL